MNLVTGRTPGGAVWSSPQNMLDAHPDQIAMIRNHCRLLKTRAKDFLMLGKMLHPYELTVPRVEVTTAVRRGDKWTREPVPTPAPAWTPRATPRTPPQPPTAAAAGPVQAVTRRPWDWRF